MDYFQEFLIHSFSNCFQQQRPIKFLFVGYKLYLILFSMDFTIGIKQTAPCMQNDHVNKKHIIIDYVKCIFAARINELF